LRRRKHQIVYIIKKLLGTRRRGEIMTIDPESFTRRIGIFSSVGMILIGIIGVLGWSTGLYLTFRVSGIILISPVSAIAYILLGSIILALIIPLKNHYVRLAVKFLVSFIMAIACMFWIAAIFFPDIDIQKLVVTPLVGPANLLETKISPLVAFAIFLGTVALVRSIYHKIKWRHYDTFIGILAIVIFSIGFMSLIGYLFGTPEFYGSSIGSVSFLSSIALVLFGLGIIAINGTSKWPSSVFSSKTVSAQLIRILVPLIVVAFLAFSWVLFRVVIPLSAEPVVVVTIFTAISIASVAYTVSYVSGSVQRVVEKAQNEKMKAIESLALANKKLEILDSLTRHDVLNQISLASIEAELTKGMSTEPKVRESAENIAKINKTIINLLQFSKEYRKVGVEEPRWMNLKEMLSDAIDKLNRGKIGMNYDCGDWRVYADPMIEKAFFNILENSIRHGERITKVLIECAVSKEDGTLRIVFSDDGIGIPEGEKERIFEKGVGKNTGLGLFLVRQILMITDIIISENGTPGKGARFEIVVPKNCFKVGGQDGAAQRA
jgi:signal transduction histidine kinase